MEVNLSPDKEARIRQLASRTGKDAAQVVEEAVDRMLNTTNTFSQPLRKGALPPAVAICWSTTKL